MKMTILLKKLKTRTTKVTWIIQILCLCSLLIKSLFLITNLPSIQLKGMEL